MSAPTVGGVLIALLRDPLGGLIRRWNWKAALLSAVSRAALFFVVNLPAGQRAAVAALLTELAFRGVTSGFYGALTQALGRAEPVWIATLSGMVLLPIVSHSAEFLVHWLSGTPRLGESIAASAAFTAFSTAFHMFAMRRGVLTVGDTQRPLRDDLRRLPATGVAFVAAIGRGVGAIIGRTLRGVGRPSAGVARL